MLFKNQYPHLGFAVYEGRVINKYSDDLMIEYVLQPLGLRKPKLPIIMNNPPPAPIIQATRSFPVNLPAPPPMESSLSFDTTLHLAMTLFFLAAAIHTLANFSRAYQQRGRQAIMQCAAMTFLLLYQLRFLFDLSILPILNGNTLPNILEEITETWGWGKPRGFYDDMETWNWGRSIDYASVAKIAWLLIAVVCFLRLCNGLHWLFERVYQPGLVLIDIIWVFCCTSALGKAYPGILTMFHGTNHDVAVMLQELVWTLKQLAHQRGLLVKDLPYAAPVIAIYSMIAYLISISAETSRLSASRESSQVRKELQIQSEKIESLEETGRLRDMDIKALEDRVKLLSQNKVPLSRLGQPMNDPDATASANTPSKMGEASELASEGDVPDNAEAAGTQVTKKRNRKRGGAGRPRNEHGLVGVGKKGKSGSGAEEGPSTTSA